MRSSTLSSESPPDGGDTQRVGEQQVRSESVHGGRARIPGLDGIRGLAIAIVMVHHFMAAALPGTFALDPLLFDLAAVGWSGVDLFFVLSGFLITGVLLDTKSEPHFFRNFYARRSLRILPLYYAVLALVYLVLPLVDQSGVQEYLGDSSGDQVWFWTHLANVRIAMRSSFYGHLIPDVFWSLAIEEQFYLLWPPVVLLLGRRSLRTTCLVLIASALGLRCALAAMNVSYEVGYVLTPARWDSLAIGALLALLARDAGGLLRWRSPARLVAVAAALVLALSYVLVTPLEREHVLTQTVGISALGALCGALLVLVLTAPAGTFLRRVFEARTLRGLGKYSYALYLVHGPIMSLVAEVFDPMVAPLVLGSALPNVLLYGAISGPLAVAAAYLSWHLLERHCLGLKRHFEGNASK